MRLPDGPIMEMPADYEPEGVVATIRMEPGDEDSGEDCVRLGAKGAPRGKGLFAKRKGATRRKA